MTVSGGVKRYQGRLMGLRCVSREFQGASGTYQRGSVEVPESFWVVPGDVKVVGRSSRQFQGVPSGNIGI